jgi:signal transduction histidine kinase
LQSLYAIGLSLEQSRRLTPNVARRRRPSGPQTVDQLNNLIQDIRRMIHGLEHDTIEEFDLASELRVLVYTYSQIGKLQIAMELQPAAVEILTGEEEREILNIVREALSNCIRHARASHATITLQTRGSRIRLTIADDGTGFDSNKNQFAGYGLANMATRAKKLGGQLSIRSRMGHGTHVIAEFSLEPILSPV